MATLLNSLIRFCVREPLIVLVVLVIVVAFGWLSTQQVPIDAIPNIGENQVIVFTAWPGRSPKDVEDQVTYPLSVSLLAVPGAKSVRGKSLFGYSFVQVTFADDIDFYWARSRVSEQLGTAAAQLPDGVTPTLGPDATALGQIFYYVLDAPTGMNLADLRSLQDFKIKYALESVDGVSEVASVGGYIRQYQVEVNPEKLRFFNVTLSKVVEAIQQANLDVGAKTIEASGMEYIVRGKGFLGVGGDVEKAISDLKETIVVTRKGVPVRIKDLAVVQLGPEFRRGAIDWNGTEAVGGLVAMRYGENPRQVIDKIKNKIKQIEPFLGGVKIRGIYDRTGLINETVGTLTSTLFQEILITVVVILLFLLHIRASLVVATTLPIAVLMAFAAMNIFGIDANIMSLAGIAIAIGTMVDMGIVMSENIYQHLTDWETAGSPGGREKRLKVIEDAATEVAPAIATAVTTTVVSFLPVFFLTGRDHKLFAPLAWTKSFALVASLIVAVTLVPFLSRFFLSSMQWPRWKSILAGGVFAILTALTCFLYWGKHISIPYLGFWPLVISSGLLGFFVGYLLTSEKLRPIDNNPVSWLITTLYAPTLRLFLRNKIAFLIVPLGVFLFGIGAWGPRIDINSSQGRQIFAIGKTVGLWAPEQTKDVRFNVPALLRPLELAGKSVGADLNALPGYVDLKHSFQGLDTDDWIALDEGSWFYMPTFYPAASFSLCMQVLQTQDVLIKEIPEVEHVLGKIGRVESALDPAPTTMVETYVILKPKEQWREGMTNDKIWEEINRVGTLPGVTPASPLQPIEGRVVMLQSGIKASMAIRIYGDSLAELSVAAKKVAEHLKTLSVVNSGTVNPDIVLGKAYVEFDVDRESAARYGISTVMVNQIVATALGGKNITTTVEGRERYPVRVRYPRAYRENIQWLENLPVVTHMGEIIPLKMLAKMNTTWGPGGISSENARLVAHVSFSPSKTTGDLQTVETVMASLQDPATVKKLNLPDGYELEAVGSFENQIEANQRLQWMIPLVMCICFFLIYLQFRHIPITIAVFAGIPVAFAGGMIFLAIYQVEMNTAVWVGFIALFGIAVDDGVVMATYLDQVFTRKKLQTVEDIRSATVEAGLRRIRPCLMTTLTTLAALLPVLLSESRGSDIARAMALPVIGGMTLELITLFVVPLVYCGFKELKLRFGFHDRHWQGIDDTAT